MFVGIDGDPRYLRPSLGEQVSDIPDGLGIVLIQHRVDARLTCSCDARLGVIEEYHLRWLGMKAFAGESIDPGLRLTHSALVGVDDLIDEILESVGVLFSFPGADEAVTHDPGAVSRAQQARSRSVPCWRYNYCRNSLGLRLFSFVLAWLYPGPIGHEEARRTGWRLVHNLEVPSMFVTVEPILGTGQW